MYKALTVLLFAERLTPLWSPSAESRDLGLGEQSTSDIAITVVFVRGKPRP